MEKERTDIYEIRVKGHLDERRIHSLGELKVAHTSGGETVLTGLIPDQAALYGLLNRLRDLGIPLLAVNIVGRSIEAGPRILSL
jgi:hypothetical protein